MEPLPLREKVTEKTGESENDKKDGAPAAAKVTTRTIVLADGTYGTEEVTEGGAEEVQTSQQQKSPWRDSITGGDFLLGTVAAFSVTKLLMKPETAEAKIMNRTLLFIASCAPTAAQPAARAACYAAVMLSLKHEKGSMDRRALAVVVFCGISALRSDFPSVVSSWCLGNHLRRWLCFLAGCTRGCAAVRATADGSSSFSFR